jgi:TonB-linked SusC/RagA family outer membrane protein
MISLNFAFPFSGYGQGGNTVTGKVTDENSEPLAGVTVNVKGSNVTTNTNAAGDYSIKVLGRGAILVFSYVGLTTVEERVGNSNTLNIRLLVNAKGMGEVIVTALNIKKNPRSLGYSVVQLDGSKVNTVQTPSIVNALSGKVAGVDVGNIANGVAGTKRIVIRGATSLTGNNNPLWVVDGIPINTSSLGGMANTQTQGGRDYGDGLTGINPDDIESISVLKGNAAAALYGSRASNGVILITTKSGKGAKGKMNVDVSSSVLLDKFVDLTHFQNEYGQSSINQLNETDLPTNAANASGATNWGHRLVGTPSVQFDGVIRPFSAVKDNAKRFFNTGSDITNTIALSGSNANQDYRVSISDLRHEDIVPNSKFTRTTINTKAHSKFGKLDADVVLSYIYEKANNRPFIGGNIDNLFYSLLFLPNSVDIETLKPGYDSTGREFLYTRQLSISNPYYIVNKYKEVDTRNRLTGSVSLKYQFASWLYARGRVTRDYYLAKRLQYIPDNNASSDFPYSSPSNIGGLLDQRSLDNTENNYELLIGIDPSLKGKFNINGFVGGNINWRAATQLGTSGNTFIVPGVYTFNNLRNKLPFTGDSKQRTNSLFGNLELSYNKYLYLTVTGRNDWFSTLPLDNNNLFYPAAALSFVFSDAIKLPSAISFGKLRASTAQVSGDTDPYQLDLSYSLNPLLYNGLLPLQTIGTSNIPNRKLKPFLSTDYEFGLEMYFLNSRFGFDVAYYNRQIKNDIIRTAVSNTTGYSTAIINVGKSENKGIEILLTGTPVKGKNFAWDINMTFSKNDNRISALGEAGKGVPIVLATSKSANAFVQLVEGKRYGSIYGSIYLRDPATGKKVYDNNGFPLVDPKPGFLGNSSYDKLFGFSNTFSYKNFSLFFFLDGKFGADIYSETNALAYFSGKHKATLAGRENGIIGDGVNQSGGVNTVLVSPQNISSYYKWIRLITEGFVYDASFIKLREVALRYKFEKSFLNKIGFTNASVALVVRNLLTVYKNRNLDNVDPESQVANNNQQGIERITYPTTRNYGITLKFGL